MSEVKLPEYIDSIVREMIAPKIKTNISEGELLPVSFVVNSSTKEIGIVMTHFDGNTPDEVEFSKMQYATAIKRVVHQFKADCVVFVCESYMLKDEAAKDFEKDRSKYPTVSSHPDRKEVVFFSIETKKHVYTAWCDIKTENDKRVIDDPVFIEMSGMQGKFTHFLGPRAV